MKIFIKTNELASKSPNVIAYYPDSSEVSDDAHGEGTTVLMLPNSALIHRLDEGGTPLGMTLIDDWRQRFGSAILETEANKRAADVATPSEQLNMLHELVDLIVQHGSDVSKWPQDAKARKAEIDEIRNYIGEVKERVRAHGTLAPPDPTSDKIWPTRIARRK